MGEIDVDPNKRTVSIDQLTFIVDAENDVVFANSATTKILRLRAKVSKTIKAKGLNIKPTLIVDIGMSSKSIADIQAQLMGKLRITLRNVELKYPDLFDIHSSYYDFDIFDPDKYLSQIELPEFDPDQPFEIFTDGLLQKGRQITEPDLGSIASIIGEKMKGILAGGSPDVSIGSTDFAIDSKMRISLLNAQIAGVDVRFTPQFRVEIESQAAEAFKENKSKYKELKSQNRSLLTFPEIISRMRFIVKVPMEFPLFKISYGKEAFASTFGGLQNEMLTHLRSKRGSALDRTVEWYSQEFRGVNFWINSELKFFPHIEEDYAIIYPLSSNYLYTFPMYGVGAGQQNIKEGLFYVHPHGSRGKVMNTADVTDLLRRKYDGYLNDEGQLQKLPVFFSTMAQNAAPLTAVVEGILMSIIKDPVGFFEQQLENTRDLAAEANDQTIRFYDKVKNKAESFGDPVEVVKDNGEDIENLAKTGYNNGRELLQGAYRNGKRFAQHTLEFYSQAGDHFININSQAYNYIIETVFKRVKKWVSLPWPLNSFWKWVWKKEEVKKPRKMRMYGIEAGEGGRVKMEVKGKTSNDDVVYWASPEDNGPVHINLLLNDEGRYRTNGHFAKAVPAPGYKFKRWVRTEGKRGSYLKTHDGVRMWPESVNVKDRKSNGDYRITLKAEFERSHVNVVMRNRVWRRRTLNGAMPGYLRITGYNKRLYGNFEMEMLEKKDYRSSTSGVSNNTGSGISGLVMKNGWLPKRYVDKTYRFEAVSNLEGGFEFSHWSNGDTTNTLVLSTKDLVEGSMILAFYEEILNVRVLHATPGAVPLKTSLTIGEKEVPMGFLEDKFTIRKKDLNSVRGKVDDNYEVIFNSPGHRVVKISYKIPEYTAYQRADYIGIMRGLTGEVVDNMKTPLDVFSPANPNTASIRFARKYLEKHSDYRTVQKEIQPGTSAFLIPNEAIDLVITIGMNTADYVRFRPSKSSYEGGYIQGLPDWSTANLELVDHRMLDSKKELYYVIPKSEFANSDPIVFKPAFGYRFRKWKHRTLYYRKDRRRYVRYTSSRTRKDIGSRMKELLGREELWAQTIEPIYSGLWFHLNLHKLDANEFTPYEITDKTRGFVYNRRKLIYFAKHRWEKGFTVKAPESNKGRTFVKWEADRDYCVDMYNPVCECTLLNNPLITPHSDQKIYLRPVYDSIPSVPIWGAKSVQQLHNTQQGKASQPNTNLGNSSTTGTQNGLIQFGVSVAPNPSINKRFGLVANKEIPQYYFPLKMKLVEVRYSIVEQERVINNFKEFKELINVQKSGFYQVLIHDMNNGELLYDANVIVH